MKRLLGEEYEAFEKAMFLPESVHGLWVNRVKCAPDSEADAKLRQLPKVPYCENGRFVVGEGWGNHPLHRAGAYYLQDPSAMGPVCALDVSPGWKVLDLCASPGGKTVQLSAMIGDEGLLYANEINPTRCHTLLGNVERLGLRNVILSCADGASLAEEFPSFFDLVLLDAPCSGEGMFRKNPEALRQWNEGAVAALAEKQKRLLEAACQAVIPGGYLLYSTCTFSEEENEGQIASFLLRHPEFDLCPVRESLRDNTVPGVPLPGFPGVDFSKMRRFYPHRTEGEGQFVALLKRKGVAGSSGPDGRRYEKETGDERILSAFLREVLTDVPPVFYHRGRENVSVTQVPAILPKHGVLCAGVTLGEIRKERLVAHHQFFSAYGGLFRNRMDLSGGSLPSGSGGLEPSSFLLPYLHGDSFPTEGQDGWGCVTVDGVPLGGFKCVDGLLKNYYPKGLRI
ncbi:MAG: SAM-dependent methyltransferase [Clostridia bacterium]|nr:SAM-dependent methyltransferase [Clostridia bacterium]